MPKAILKEKKKRGGNYDYMLAEFSMLITKSFLLKQNRYFNQ